MSIMRCERHGSWDSDLHERCELCDINEQEANELRDAANIVAKRLSKDSSCCGHDSDCAVHNMPAYPNGPCDC